MKHDEIPAWAADAASSILQTVLKKDPFTFHHCCRVGLGARRLGKAMQLSNYEQALLEYSGLFHDIGKVGLSDSILLKPGRLTADEFNMMKDHAQMSVDIIRPLTRHAFFRFMIPGIRYHHERFDGKGYPNGLMGEKIPLLARTIAIVDAVDAMMHVRPYREAQSWEYAQKELLDYSGTQFDPNLVRIFLEATNNGIIHGDATHEEVVVPLIIKAA
jgi:HD-GYP domain-containing protein (c-di-GMP phosphodiesterase class II)